MNPAWSDLLIPLIVAVVGSSVVVEGMGSSLPPDRFASLARQRQRSERQSRIRMRQASI